MLEKYAETTARENEKKIAKLKRDEEGTHSCDFLLIVCMCTMFLFVWLVVVYLLVFMFLLCVCVCVCVCVRVRLLVCLSGQINCWFASFRISLLTL